MGWTAEESGFHSHQRQESFLLSALSKQALGPTQWVLGALSPRVNWPYCEAQESGFNSWQGWEIYSLLHSFQLGLGPTQPSVWWIPGVLSLRIEWQKYEAGHSPRYSAEVKNMWVCTSTPLYVFMLWSLIKDVDRFVSVFCVLTKEKLWYTFFCAWIWKKTVVLFCLLWISSTHPFLYVLISRQVVVLTYPD